MKLKTFFTEHAIDPEVTEVMVNGPDDVYVVRKGRMEKVSVSCRFAIVRELSGMSPNDGAAEGATRLSGEDLAFPRRREEFTVLHAAKSLTPVWKEDVHGFGARVFKRDLDSVGVVALRQSNVEANARSSDLTSGCLISESLIEQVDNRL